MNGITISDDNDMHNNVQNTKLITELHIKVNSPFIPMATVNVTIKYSSSFT